MTKSLFPKQIIAKSPGILFAKVSDELCNGLDLYTTPFVAFTGEIVQYMAPSTCLYEYRLIDAPNLSEFDDHIQSLTALGFDFFMSTVMWNGYYLQWMCKMKDQLSAISAQQVELIADHRSVTKLHFVEHAMPVMRGRFLTGGLQ